MLKNKYLVLFLLFIFLIIFLVFSKTAQKQTPKSTTPENKIETSLLPSQTVINFYDSYLTYSGNLLSENAYEDSEYLTDDLKTKIKNEISKKPLLNPILCSNEKPEEVRVHSATISGDFAQVLVTQTLRNKSFDNKLKLKLLENKYKIYDIICN